MNNKREIGEGHTELGKTNQEMIGKKLGDWVYGKLKIEERIDPLKKRIRVSEEVRVQLAKKIAQNYKDILINIWPVITDILFIPEIQLEFLKKSEGECLGGGDILYKYGEEAGRLHFRLYGGSKPIFTEDEVFWPHIKKILAVMESKG
jgi:hypothetical protein